MNKSLLLFILLLAGACQRDTAVEPVDLLYRRWRLLQYRLAPVSAWTVNTDTQADTEFRPDGVLIYRRTNTVTPTPCCASSRFERMGNTLNFPDQNFCPAAECTVLGAGYSSTISQLTDDLLELTNGNLISQLTPVN